MMTLNGLGSQISEGNTEILKKISEIETNGKVYLENGRNYLDELWVENDKDFKELVLKFLPQIAEDAGHIRQVVDRIENKVASTYPKTLTAAPPRIDLTKYVERGTFLEDLHKDLEAGNNALLLNGLGGVGKSTLAAVYVQKYEKEYDHIAWLSQTDTFENMLLSAKTLHDSLKLSMEGIDTQNLSPTIFNAMKKVSGKKLLVLDNVDESLNNFKNNLPADYRLLLTSREKIGLGFTEKVVGKLNPNEAKSLIKKHLFKTTPTENEIETFCELLDYHALSIELLVKTLEESLDLERLSDLSDYLKTNQLDAEELQEEVFTNHSKEDVAVYGHLIQSFTLAKLEKYEIWALLQFAILPPFEHEYVDLAEWLQEEKKAFGEVLRTLHKKGWIEKKGSKFSMHRMVQTLVKYQENPNEINTKELVATFSQKLKIDQTKDNPVDKFQWIEYGKFIYDSRETDNLHEKISELANNLALVLQALGYYSGAKTLLKKALESDEANFGETHPRTAVRYSNLAIVLQDLGDFAGAKSLLEKALNSDLANFGETHSDTSRTQSNLALVLQDFGDYKGAKTLLEKALNADKINFCETHPITVGRYSNLALVLKDLGDYLVAKSLLEKVLISDRANFGETHPTMAVRYSNLAMVFQDLGDYLGAKGFFLKALRSNKANFGETHPNTARAQLNLAMALWYLKDYLGAKEFLEKALSSNKVTFGEKHPNTARTLSNLALVLQDLGDYQGAKLLLEKALKSDETNYGEKHPTTAISYHNYGTLLGGAMNKPCEGLKWCLKAYQIFNEHLGISHPNTETVKSWVDYLTETCKKQKPQSLD